MAMKQAATIVTFGTLYTLVEMALDASPCAGEECCGSPECALATAVLDRWATDEQLAEWLWHRDELGDWGEVGE